MDSRLDNAPCGFISFGDDGVIQEANQTLAGLLAVERQELVGRHFESILSTPSRIFYQTHLLPLLKMSGAAEEIYMSLRSSQGAQVPVMVNGVRHGESTRYECVLVPMRRRDVYENELLASKKATEEAYERLEVLQRSLQQKQDELALRNCELETLREHLEERVEARTSELLVANEELERLAYSMAHNLRAPMRAIASTSAILKEEMEERLSAEQHELFGRQTENVRVLSTLLDDLLEYSRISRRPVVASPVDLSSTATEVMERVAARYPDRHHPFVVDPGMEDLADPPMMRLLLYHLLDNAAKFSPEGGEIRFSRVSAMGRQAYCIQDVGIGIDPRFFGKIFMPFERLHLEEFPGNGIGLAIAARIVQRHRGSIWMESELGKGSSVCFTLAGQV